MSCNVFANCNEIACKGGGNKVIAEFPDVCLSPPSPPAGPIPLPYPDTSLSADMKEGSKTVLIKDKEVMLKDKSYYKTSPLGDEAATNGLGANVLSHTITGKTYCVAWSMDVKFEGENVDRHMDMTTSNHMCAPQPGGTPPATLTIGTFQPLVPGLYSDQTCDDATRTTRHDEVNRTKAIQKVQVPKKPHTDPVKKAKLCGQLNQRISDQEDHLRARQTMNDDCFASPKNTPDEQTRQADHVRVYGEQYGSYQDTLADRTRMGC